MKKIIRRFAPRTIPAVLLVLFAVAAVTVWAAENNNSNTKNEIDLQFSTKIQLTTYVDGAWSDALSDDYGFGDTATLTAPAKSGSKNFSHWEAGGSVISYSNPLKLTMNAHTTLYAVYTSTAETEKPVSGFTSITRTNEGDKISFQAIAGGGTVQGVGIVYSTTASGETLKIGGTDVTNVAAEKLSDTTSEMPQSVLDGNNCWMLRITPDSDSTVYHARTYVTIGGTTTYGDVKDVKLSDLESGISLVADPDGMHPDGENDSKDIKSLLADVKMYTVTFDANGGTGTMEPQAVLGGTATALNTNTFTRDNYTFSGWSTNQNGGGTTYTDGQSATFSADTTLYAQWKKSGGSGDTTPGGSSGTPVTPGKTTPAKPSAPTLESKTETSITVKAVAGQEYSIDGGKTWQTSGTFTGLTPETEYSIVTKITATSTANESPVSDALTVTTDKKADTSTPTDEPGGSSGTPGTSGKTTPAKPSAPTLESKTDTTITVKAVSGQEYSIDGGKTWQTSGTFTGLTPETEYSIVTKITATSTANESPVSDALKVTTDKKADTSTPTDKPTETPGSTTTPTDKPTETPGSTTPTNTPDGTTTPAASTDKVTSAEKAKAKIKLNAGLKVSQTGKKVTVKWGKVSGADRYVVYAAYCNSGKCKKVGTLSGSKTSMTFAKLNGSKLNLKKNVKVYVVAYRKVNGKETKLARSITAHIVGSKNAKYTNVKKIKLSKSKYTLKANKTATIKAKIVLVDKKKKQLSDSHAPEFRYASSNTKVATVDKNGKITAVKKGTCYIYVYAKNGYAKKVKVTVK